MTRLLLAFCVLISSLRLSAAAVVVRSVSAPLSPALGAPALIGTSGNALSFSAPALSVPTLNTGALPVIPVLESGTQPAAARTASRTVPAQAQSPAPRASRQTPAAPAFKKRLAALTRGAAPLAEAARDRNAADGDSHAAGSRLIRLLNGGEENELESAPVSPGEPGLFSRFGARLKQANAAHAHFDFMRAGVPVEETARAETPAPDLSPRQKKQFRVYATGVSAVKVGIETLHFVVPLLLLSQYGAASLVGGLFVASDLAGLVLGWAGSSWIDRLKPGRVMTAAALTQFAAIGAIPAALWLGMPLGLPAVMGLVVLNGAASGLFDIARRAQMPHLIGTDEGTLRRYNGELYVWREIAAIAGVFAAGALLSATGYLETLILHPAFYMIAGYLFWRMTRGNRPGGGAAAIPAGPKEPSGIKHAWREISRGARIVISNPRLLLAAVVNIPVLTIHNLFHKMLAAVYATAMLGSPSFAAILIGAWNLGEFVSAIYLRTRGHKEGSAKWLVYAGFAGMGLWAMTFFPSIWVAAPMIFLLATATLSNELGLVSFFQSSVGKEDAGAVNGFVYSSANGLSMVALLALGWAFDAWGVPAGMTALAVVMSGVSVFYWLAALNLKRSGRDQPSGPAVNSADEPPPVAAGLFLKRWKLWLVVAAVLGGGLFGAHQYFAPRLDPVTPPDAVVIVDKSPYAMAEVPGAAIERFGDSPRIVLSGNSSAILAFTMRADRKAAVSVSEDGTWKLWDLESGKVYAPEHYPGKARTALFADGGRKLILVDDDGTVRVSMLRTGELQTIERDLEAVLFDAISPDAWRVAVGTSDNQVHLLEIDGAKTAAFAVGGKILAVGSTEAGEMVLTSSRGIVKLWKVAPGQAPTVVVEKYLPGLKIKGSALSRSGDRLIALADMAGDQIVLAWRFGTQEVQMLMGADFAGEDAPLAAVAATPDGTRVAILAKDGRLWTWTPGSGEPALIGKAESGVRVFFSKTGTMIWTADQAGRLQAWIIPMTGSK